MVSKKKFAVGFSFNTIPPEWGEDKRRFYCDHGEWDSGETIGSVVNALEKSGNKVLLFNSYKDGSYDVYHELDKHKDEVDIVFNIAEGFKSRNRESLVPAMLEWLNIPFTGSDLGSLAKVLNKADTIEILQNYGINIAPFFVFKESDISDLRSYTDKLRRIVGLFSSVIVKPVAEGTSVGMSQGSVVDDPKALKDNIAEIISKYNQPAMVQQFLGGEEYTVGILGNLVLPILKIDLKKIPESPKIRDVDVKEIDIGYSVPARFSESYVGLAAQAAVAHAALSCRDYNRLDFRKGKDGKIYFLEANPLPGLNPSSSDFPKICRLAGIPYDVAVNAVLFEAVKRYQQDNEFVERFSDKRVKHIDEFIRPCMGSLDSFNVGIPADSNVNNTPYQLIKVKK